MFIGFLVAPIFQIVGIGTQISEALAGLERTREVLRERPEDEDPAAQSASGRISGQWFSKVSNFAYDPGKTVLHDVSFESAARIR
jgi:ABC-type bacteriocin/lantibiotic exporter with double-glycine peptidase domain